MQNSEFTLHLRQALVYAGRRRNVECVVRNKNEVFRG
jgi:hypothetical protein